jgi:MYXO-CTERM domain-containing protein
MQLPIQVWKCVTTATRTIHRLRHGVEHHVGTVVRRFAHRLVQHGPRLAGVTCRWVPLALVAGLGAGTPAAGLVPPMIDLVAPQVAPTVPERAPGAGMAFVPAAFLDLGSIRPPPSLDSLVPPPVSGDVPWTHVASPPEDAGPILSTSVPPPPPSAVPEPFTVLFLPMGGLVLLLLHRRRAASRAEPVGYVELPASMNPA